MPPRTDVPVFAENLYSRTAILDPYPQYARLRALGPVVWLSKHKVYALPRYADCKAVLLDDATFISGAGVGLNPLVNRAAQGTTLNSDGCPHADRRSLVAPRLTPRALRAMQESVEEQADRVVEEAVGRGHVDGVGDVAMALPMAVVPDLVGWPQEGRSELLKWGAAAFDALGPLNRRSIGSIPAGLELKRYARGVVARREVLPGSMADDLLRAADEGKVAIDDCPALMIDYMAPSIDTTLSAIASALHLFSRHPEQWSALQEDPSRVPNAVNEVVRLESPLRAFSRKVTATTDVGGTSVPAGSRVLVMYASANRDELEWDNPDAFDISRDAGRQLGFGHGTHGCAGQGLARLETQAILRALLRRVDRIEPAGEPTWALNNIIHRLEHLPLRLVPRG